LATELLFFTSCFKDSVEEPPDPKVDEVQVSEITYCSAKFEGNLEGSAVEWGVCFSTTRHPEVKYNSSGSYITFPIFTSGSYTVTYSGLSENTTYFVRAFAGTYFSRPGELPGYKIIYGPEISFTTLKLDTMIRFSSVLTYGSVSDIEGNTYKTI
jgi:hypothetical protein